MDHGTTGAVGEQHDTRPDLAGWRQLGGRATAWFETPSQAVAAGLIDRVVQLAGSDDLPELALRRSGVRVRLAAGETPSPAVTAAAEELGLRADPSALQEMGWVIGTGDQTGVISFWQTVLGYQPDDGSGLIDPLRRDPTVRFFHLDGPRPLRNRLHLDVGRTAEAVEAARATLVQQPHGPWQVALADPDGNEVDLCPGGQLSPEPGSSDWVAVFSAMAFYLTSSAGQAVELITAVAGAADEAGIPLLIDLRPDGVMIDSGKDQWEGMDGADPRYVDLAVRVQSVARDLGLTADPARTAFVQLGIDAVDVPAARAFWATVLGYQYDPRPGVTDIYDPRRLNPVIFFQDLDASDEERRRQRNRIHLELAVPADRIPLLIDIAVAAGGRVLETSSDGTQRCTLADPEDNEIELRAGLRS